MNSIRIFRGDTPTLEFEILDDTGNVVDLTDYVVYFAVKKDDAIIIDKEASVFDPTVGLVRVTLTSEETNHIGFALGELEGRHIDGTITTFGQFLVRFLEDVRK